MQARSGREAQRVAQRKNSRRPSAEPVAMRYARDNFSAVERRHALVAMLVLGLACLGLGVVYVVVAAGDIVG